MAPRAMQASNGGKRPKGSNIDEETRLVPRAKHKAQRTTNKEKEKSKEKPKAPAAGVQNKAHIRAKPAPAIRSHQRNALKALTEAGEDDRFPLRQAHRFLTGFHINETLARVMTWGEGTIEQMEEEVGGPSEEEGKGDDDDNDDDEDEPFGFYKPKDDDNDEWEGDGGDCFGCGAGGDAMQGVEGGSVGFIASSMSVTGS